MANNHRFFEYFQSNHSYPVGNCKFIENRFAFLLDECLFINDVLGFTLGRSVSKNMSSESL